jgi:hypothetical protein
MALYHLADDDRDDEVNGTSKKPFGDDVHQFSP